MRLELGSGDRPADGFVHLDAREVPGVDIVDDAATLEKVPAGSCSLIRAAHLLEHFGHTETESILRLWRSKLTDGGTIQIEVPNLTGHIDAWRRGDVDDARLVYNLFGEQDYEFNFHKTMFTEATLTRALEEAGFSWVSVRDIGLVLMALARR